jgi:hypothetical protein
MNLTWYYTIEPYVTNGYYIFLGCMILYAAYLVRKGKKDGRNHKED